VAAQAKWAGVTGQALVLDAKAAQKPGLSQDNAIRVLRTRMPWAKYGEDTLRRKLRVAKRHHGDSPPPLTAEQAEHFVAEELGLQPVAGRCVFLLREWDKSLELQEPGAEVQGAFRIAGHRNLPKLFDLLQGRTSWNGEPKRKADQIRVWIDNMADDPDWYPDVKESRPDVIADRVLALLRDGPKTRAELIVALGKSYAAISAITVRMIKSDQIIRVSLGVFGLPDTALHVLTRDAILKVLNDAAGEMTFAAIRTATAKPKTSISASLDHLIKEDIVVRVRRGVYVLARLATISHGWARDSILNLLAEAGKPMTWAALIAASGRNETAIASALTDLVAEGKIRRVSRGLYALVRPRRRRDRLTDRPRAVA
jgi:hypothetical protein